MSGPIEQEAQTPCGWCGEAITQPPTGRRLRYCNRSCRQRAYEIRTAQARLQRDIDAGHVRTQPAERVIERVVQPAYPSTAAGWAAALQELAAQVHAGQIQPWERDRIRHAAGLVTAALDAVNTPAPTAPQDDRVRLLVLRLAATSAGTGQPTTLARLAAELGIAVDAVRSVLAQLTRAGVLALTRAAPTGVAEADPDRIAEHARFAVVVRPPRR